MREKRNPGGWPTGPLESSWMYDHRDSCNAAADMWHALLEAFARRMKLL